MTFEVTIVRPYELATRQRVTEAIDRAGGRVIRVFDDPLDFESLGHWLRGDAAASGLVVPFNVFAGENGIDVLAQIFAALPVPRRTLMPLKVASTTAVEQLLAKSLGESAALVLPLALDVLGSAHGITVVREFFAGGKKVFRDHSTGGARQ